MGSNISRESFDKLPSYFKSPPVKVTICGGGKTYILHTEALSKFSGLKSMVNKEQARGVEHIPELNLDTDDEEAFDALVRFAYIDEYIYTDGQKEEGLADLSNINLHARVYILSAALGAEKTKERALGAVTAFAALDWKDPTEAKKAPQLSKLLDDIIRTIPLFYLSTHDTDSTHGRLTGHKSAFKTQLARICATYVEELRKKDDFIAMLKKYPDLSTDILVNGSEKRKPVKGNAKRAPGAAWLQNDDTSHGLGSLIWNVISSLVPKFSG